MILEKFGEDKSTGLRESPEGPYKLRSSAGYPMAKKTFRYQPLKVSKIEQISIWTSHRIRSSMVGSNVDARK